MGSEGWTIESLPGYISRSEKEIEWLWSSTLPTTRDTNPAVWDSVIGFFEDAIVASSSQPGHLVVTPRELLKQMKHNGREPASGMRVITELFKRGDVVLTDDLKPPSKEDAEESAYSFKAIRATLTGYIWGGGKKAGPSLDDELVPVAALKAAAGRASSLSGPMMSADVHTVKTFATAVTAGNVRDAKAVISHIVDQGEAAVLFTDPTKEQPEATLGVKLGKGRAVEADKGVLTTKAALERMEDMASHLEGAVEAERQAATAAARGGDKSEALMRLRKKKVLETKLNSTRAAATKLCEVLMAVDEAETNREAVNALETGMASLKTATADGVTPERLDAVASDFDDVMAEQADVRVAFQQINTDVTGGDAALEEELKDLLEGGDAVAANAAETMLAPAAKQPDRLQDEAEAELAKLLAELPMPTAPTSVGASASASASASAAEVEKKDVQEEAETAAL